MTSNAWLAESLIIGAGVTAIPALLLIGWALDRRAGREFHVPQHAALDEASLPAGEIEPDTDGSKSVIIEPDGTPTRPVPAEPVEHEGATADWSPTQELALVPARPLDGRRRAVRRLRRTIDDDAMLRRDLARIERDARAAIARVGHLEQDTCSWTVEEIAALVAEAKAGAQR